MANEISDSKEFYESFFAGEQTLTYDNSERYERLFELIASLPLPRSASVLDVGGGTGRISKWLAERFDHVTTVDITISESLRDAGVNSQVIQAALPDLPYQSEAFDLVVCSEVLEHIPRSDQAASVGELGRVTTDSGYLVLTTPNPRSLFELCNGARDGQLIENWLPPSILQDYIGEQGLTVQRSAGSYYMLPQLTPLAGRLPVDIFRSVSDFVGDRGLLSERGLYQYYVCTPDDG